MLFVIVIHITVLNTKKIHYILVIETGQNKGTNMIYQALTWFTRHIWKGFYSLYAQPNWQQVYKLFLGLQTTKYFSLQDAFLKT